MKAMVLAAGLGTRLRPLTDDKPKALVTLAGKTLLEITLLTLRSFGVDEVIVNVHHFADRICEFLDENGNFGMRIEISHEDRELLDTGGGLKKAAWFFLEDEAHPRHAALKGQDFSRAPNIEKTGGASAPEGHSPSSPQETFAALKGQDFSRAPNIEKTGEALASEGRFTSNEPFILHNVDVLSTIDLERMVRHHIEQGALATLAVQQRETSRYLLFDENGHLCGRRKGRDGQPEIARPAAHPQPLAFAGIHVISPRLLTEMREEGAFSIIDTYLNLAARGEKIVAFRADEYYWRDLGRPENIAGAERDLLTGPDLGI
jgi:MurNAc alpha-1-phosphate uridylyltransferase